MPVNEMNRLLKISVYPQTTFAAETHLAEGLTPLRDGEDKKSLTDLVGTYKLTVSKMDEQHSMF
jgi:hypothetical protein